MAGEVGEVDGVRLRPEVRPLYRLEVDEVVDQSEEMAACGGYVVGIAGIVAAERPVGLRADRLGIGDDVIERDTQSLVQPFAESGRILERDRKSKRLKSSH